MPCRPKETFKSILSLEQKKMTEHSTSTQAMTMKTNKVDIYNQQIDNETEAVMNHRVSKSTRGSHEGSNITFILWIFDHHNKYPSLLQPTLYDMTKTNNL